LHPVQPAWFFSRQVLIAKSDYDAFERLLGDIQAAYSAEDRSAPRAKVTPEMMSYFSEQLAGNASRGLINRVTNVKLLQGDLAEAWGEGDTDYATVAMKFALKDSMVERASGRTVEGGEQNEVTELWTFMRARGGNWLLCAIQQTWWSTIRLAGLTNGICRWSAPAPPVNIEPRYHVAPEAVSAASTSHLMIRARVNKLQAQQQAQAQTGDNGGRWKSFGAYVAPPM
jgi:Tim44-like domain